MLNDIREKLGLYGSVASIIGLLTAIGVFWFSSLDAQKALSIQVLSKSTWFSGPLTPDFRLTYKDEPVKNVASVLLQIRNTGRQPITALDFEKPLDIFLSNTSKIISVEQIGAEPSDLKLPLSSEGKNVHIGPSLFNPKDMAIVSITALCEEQSSVDVNLTVARIAGIRKVDFEPDFKTEDKGVQFYTLLLALVSGILANLMSFFFFSKAKSMIKRHSEELDDIIAQQNAPADR